jgi:hypothetical protein
MLVKELFQGAKIIILLWRGDVHPFIFHIVIMIELNPEIPLIRLFQYDIMFSIGIIIRMMNRSKIEDELTNG